jgi:hypothetical protein
MNYRLLTGLFFLLLITGSAVAESVLRFNPFQQPDMALEKNNASKNVNNTLKLRGTVVDGEDSIVNIDGKFYRLDEKVSGYRVVNIESGKVTLHRGVNETVLTLNDDDKTLR